MVADFVSLVVYASSSAVERRVVFLVVGLVVGFPGTSV